MSQANIPVTQLLTANNYRRRFDPTKMNELVESIKVQGLNTPITVRPVEDGKYQVISGHRRLIAFKQANGDDATIPVFVRMLSDAEAQAAMVAENKVREDTTAIEDAEAASKLLGLLKGDKDETARRLGWSRQLLDRRLALMNASQAVRDAYIDDRVQLGHVEILATLKQESQDNVLSKVLENVKAGHPMPTVAEFKDLAARYMLDLTNVIFNKTECESCANNTGTTKSLFDTNFEGARCTNKTCYEAKTEAELQARAEGLKSEFQVVRIVRPGDNTTLVPLRIGGEKGVSEEQGKLCKQCKDFGACVSAVPQKLGQEFKNICFDLSCNTEKVKEHQKASAPPKPEKAKGAEQTGATDTNVATPKDEKANAVPKTAKPDEIKARQAIVEYREDLWRKILSKACESLTHQQAHALLIGICMAQPARIDTTALGDKIKGFSPGLTIVTAATAAMQRSEDDNARAVQLLCSALDSVTSISEIMGLLKLLNVDIAEYWKASEKFFTRLTKSEIDAVCEEIGIAAHMGKDYVKAKNGSKEEFVKAVSSVQGFRYAGAIPKIVRWN